MFFADLQCNFTLVCFSKCLSLTSQPELSEVWASFLLPSQVRLSHCFEDLLKIAFWTKIMEHVRQ